MKQMHLLLRKIALCICLYCISSVSNAWTQEELVTFRESEALEERKARIARLLQPETELPNKLPEGFSQVMSMIIDETTNSDKVCEKVLDYIKKKYAEQKSDYGLKNKDKRVTGVMALNYKGVNELAYNLYLFKGKDEAMYLVTRLSGGDMGTQFMRLWHTGEWSKDEALLQYYLFVHQSMILNSYKPRRLICAKVRVLHPAPLSPPRAAAGRRVGGLGVYRSWTPSRKVWHLAK